MTDGKDNKILTNQSGTERILREQDGQSEIETINSNGNNRGWIKLHRSIMDDPGYLSLQLFCECHLQNIRQ